MIDGLSDRLRQLRIKSGMSQKQVAERLRISPSIVSGYETGERTPSIEVLLAISNLYHCCTDYLLGKTTAKPSDSIPVDGLSVKQIQAIRALVESIRKS